MHAFADKMSENYKYFSLLYMNGSLIFFLPAFASIIVTCFNSPLVSSVWPDLTRATEGVDVDVEGRGCVLEGKNVAIVLSRYVCL